jgi:hypothetical protein
MERIALALRATLATVAVLGVAACLGQSSPVSRKTESAVTPIFGVELPSGYRDWKLISVAHEEGQLDDLRAILGNDVAIESCRDGSTLFPDGSIIARLAWAYVPMPESEQAFGHAQSFMAGPSKGNVQFMVKDSKRYRSTGGWGFAQFNEGKPADQAVHETCFPCHAIAKGHDFVFNHYSP